MKIKIAEKGLFVTIFWLPLLNIVMYIGLLVSLVGCSGRIYPTKETSALDWSVVIFTVIVFCSIFTSVNKLASIYGFIAFCAYPIAYFVFSKNVNRENLSKILNLIVLSFLVVVVIGALQAMIIIPHSFINLSANKKIFDLLGWDISISVWRGARIVSTLGNSNVLGAYLVFVLPVLAGIFLQKPSLKKAIIFTLGVLLLFFTYSRSAWIGFFAGILAISIFSGKKLPVFLITLLLASSLFIPAVRHRLQSGLSPSPGSGYSGRTAIWKTSLDIIRTYPILGTGINTFYQVYPDFRKAPSEDFSHAHNMILQVGCEAGFLGMASFIVFIGLFLVLASKVCKKFALEKSTASDGWVIIGKISAAIGFIAQNSFDCFLSRGQIGVLFFSFVGIIKGMDNLETV